MPAVLRVCP